MSRCCTSSAAGRGLVTLGEAAAQAGSGAPAIAGGETDLVHVALRALADAVRSGRVGKLALERIDGEPAIASELAGALRELGFSSGPRKLTLSA